MSDELTSDETLAALIDGTLTPAERERVLHRLSQDPEAYARFVESAQVVAALREEPHETAASPRPVRARARQFLGYAVPLLAAASLAGVILLTRARADVSVHALITEARPLSLVGSGSVGQALGERWDEPGWTVVRGSEMNAATEGTAARAGVRLAQLEFAALAADSLAWRRVAMQLVQLLASVDGAGPLAMQLQGAFMGSAPDRAILALQIREITNDSASFDVGEWLGAARLALISGQHEFFRANGSARASLARTLASFSQAEPSRDWSMVRVQMEAIQARPSNDIAGIRSHVDSALRVLPR